VQQVSLEKGRFRGIGLDKTLFFCLNTAFKSDIETARKSVEDEMSEEKLSKRARKCKKIQENKSDWTPPSVEECVTLLKGGKEGVKKWNAMREEHPEWTPDLSGLNLSEMNLRKVNFTWANLSEADLSKACLIGALLSMADLPRADIREANLSGAEIFRTDLSEANLSGANLYQAEISEANLCGANLTRAKLHKAIFCMASLCMANLSEADCGEADLSEANLEGANLSEIKLERVKFYGVRGLKITDWEVYVASLKASIEFAD
jgi:hypothetical protein